MQAVHQQQKLPGEKKLSADKYHLLKLDERKRNMKSKFGLIRVLAIVFALVLSISLVSCVKDEDLDNVKNDAGKTQENVNQLQTDVSELKKSLETVASEIKKTADDAATKAAFESAKNALEAADSKLAEDLAAANADVEAAKADYQAKIDAITAKLTAAETTVGENAAAIAELKTALNELKTNVGSLATKAELANYVKSADLNTQIDAKVSALETKVNANVKTVSDKLTALETKVNGMATTTDLTELNNTVKALQSAVTNLQNKKFLDDYISLTEKLNGTDWEYCFKNFIDQANEVEEGPYADEEIEEFQKKIETIKFFLARATTEEEVKNAFTQLANAKASLKTLVETLREKLDNFKVIANNEQTKNDYKAIVAAYEKLSAKATEEDLEKVADYETVKNAYNNFFAAVEAGKAVVTYVNENLTGKTVIINASDEVVTTAANKLQEFKDTYFATEAYNAYYGIVNEEGKGVLAEADVVANSLAMGAEINGYGKRLELLRTAKAYATENILVEGKLVFNWNAYSGATTEAGEPVVDERPLYNNLANKALWDKIAAWSTDAAYKSDADFGTYTGCTADIEVENIKAILGADAYADLLTSVNYVGAMKDIYEKFTTVEETTLNVEAAILDEITKLISGDVVLNAENDAAMKALQALIAQLDEKIEGVENYNAADGNKLAMVSQAMRDNAKAYVDAYAAVVAKINAVKAQFYTDNKADTTKMSFREYNKITQFRTDIEEICANLKTLLTTAGVATETVTAPEAVLIEVKDDSEIVKEGCVLYELNRAYADYSADAYKAWEKAKNLLDQIPAVANLKLDMGHAIYEAFKAVSDAVNNYQLLFDDQIMLMAEDGSIEENVNLKQIQSQLEQYLKKYDELAKTAEIGAEAIAAKINAAIEAIADLDASKMDNYKKISDAQTMMNEWFNTFCSAPAGETDAEKAAALKKMIHEDLVDVPAYGLAGVVYEFVDTDLYDTLVDKYAAAVATKAAWDTAIANWNTAKAAANTTKLHTEDLHTAALKAWKAVCDLYTATLSDTYKGYAEEYDAYAEYKTTYYDVYVANCAAAEADANEIKGLINALPSINTLTDVASVTAADLANKLTEIDEKLAAFTTKYCEGDCFFWTHEGDEGNLSGTNNTDSKDYILALEKVRAMYTFLTETEGKDADLIETNRKSLSTALGLITEIANGAEGTHERLIRNVKSQMNAYTKAVNPDYVVE